MKLSTLKKIIEEIVKEEFARAPKFGDIHPTDQKTGERPGMQYRPADGMDITQHKKMMWAENIELPPEYKSDVEIPFNKIKFPNFQIASDCTVAFFKGKPIDERDITVSKEKIDLNDPYLFATQDNLYLSLEEIGEKLKNENDRTPPVVVEFPNGVKLIQDGHHRLSYDKLTGKDHSNVLLCKVNDINEFDEETEDFINSIGPKLSEVNALATGGIAATSDGSGLAPKNYQYKKHEKMWYEEKIGKTGPHGPTLFQMGGSLPDELYNRKNGKPSRDPGITGQLDESEELSEIIKKCGDDWCLYTKHKENGKRRRLGTHETKAGAEAQERAIKANESFYHGTTVDLEPGQYLLPPIDTNNISEKGRKKNLDKVFFTKDFGSAKIYAGRAKHSLGGEPKVYLIEPEGQVDIVNDKAGSTVLMAPKAKVVKRVV